MVEIACVGVLGAGAAFTDTPLNDLLKDKACTCTVCGLPFETEFELKQHLNQVEYGDRCEVCHYL